MSRLPPIAVACLIAWVLWLSPAHASHCGQSACGEEGRCREQSLLARCDCDEGFISVTTYLGRGSQGAFCAPLPAPPDEPACAALSCGPNGVCVVRSGAGVCVCDPGYRPDGAGGCEDDPADPANEACESVRCGEGHTCMATPDGATCRCSGGEWVVLGLDATGNLGPVCQAPADPTTACGPRACGPFGECVISQAAFCRCDEGAKVEEIGGSRVCVDPDRPLPEVGIDPPPDAGTDDPGGGVGGGSRPLQDDVGCGVAAAARGPAVRPQLLLRR